MKTFGKRISKLEKALNRQKEPPGYLDEIIQHIIRTDDVQGKKIIKEIEEKLSDLFVANLESSQEQVNEEIQRIIKTGDTEGQLKLMKIQELLEGLSKFYRGKPPQ